MNTTKKNFTQFIHATNATGSNKASSYILALDWLCKILQTKPFNFDDCQNIWKVTSVDRLHELYLFVLGESNKGDASEWNINGIPKSYLQKGYCSAALKCLQKFLVEYSFEQRVLSQFNDYQGDESELVKNLKTNIRYPKYLTEGLDKKQGQEVLRSVKVRINQNLFRKMILIIYNQSCCITGLNIPEVIRASHIIPWAEDSNKRLDPRNGLCLSATYDAAFDKNLISLDNDYRIILSKNITDYYTNKSVKEYFINKEGAKVMLPTSYIPHKDYLENHRSKGNF